MNGGNIIDVIEYVSYGENQNPVTSLIDIYLKEFKTYAKDTLLAMLNEYDDNLKALRSHREYGLPDYEWQKWLDAVTTK